MAGKFASGDVPDVFYVDAGYAQPVDRPGLSRPARRLHQPRRTSTRARSSTATPRSSRAPTARPTACPRTATRSRMAYNTDLVPTPPKTMDELITAGPVAEGQGRPQGAAVPEPRASTAGSPSSTPRAARCCLRRRQDRDDRLATASKKAVQWYMDLFKNGLGMSAADIGDDWCGTSLGKKHAAITFEGGWLDPAMTSTYPDVKYALGRHADRLIGQPGDDLVHRRATRWAPTRRTRTRAGCCCPT